MGRESVCERQSERGMEGPTARTEHAKAKDYCRLRSTSKGNHSVLYGVLCPLLEKARFPVACLQQQP